MSQWEEATRDPDRLSDLVAGPSAPGAGAEAGRRPGGGVASTAGGPVDLRVVAATWWPLAASWLLMAFEGPAISAVVARLADPKVNLAAYGGVVFPLALMVEAPIIMLLAASTALSRDEESYRRLRMFTHASGALLTLLHLALAVTPLFDLVVGRIMAPPQEVLEPARLGLIIMLPWTWAIGYRRFNQGVLIRFGRSRSVGAGTVVRLAVVSLVLTIGYLWGDLRGIVVAAVAVSSGVLAEAWFVRQRVKPVIAHELPSGRSAGEPPSLRGFLAFYIPLSLTSVLSLLVQPIGAAALSRMPLPLESLALWPVVIGVAFVFRSFGFAYNEVVVALIDRPGALPALRRFNLLSSVAVTAGFALLLVPVAGQVWFSDVTGLEPLLVDLGRTSLWLVLPMPALSVAISWYQGLILFSRRTRAVGEAVAIGLSTITAILVVMGLWGEITGIYAGVGAITAGELLRVTWLRRRSRYVRACLERIDREGAAPDPEDCPE